MGILSTTVRATHLVTNAAWFGGSLMGLVGLEGGAAPVAGGDRARVSEAGWRRWAPVQAGAVGLHLLSGLGIVADNRRRVAAHGPTRAAVVAKTLITAGAVGSTAAAAVAGRRVADLDRAAGAGQERELGHVVQVGMVRGQEDGSAQARRSAERLLAVAQRATPALTGALLVLDAYLGEQQRGPAGLLDRPFG